MRNVAKAVVACSLMVLATAAMAEFKVGFVNGQQVVNESPQAKAAIERIEKEFKQREIELTNLSKRLRESQDDLEKNRLTLSDSKLREKERDINELGREFQRKQREFREDLNLRKNDELAEIFDFANKVIKEIAEAEKYDLIVQDAVYFSPKIDITDKIIKALVERAKKGG